MGIKVNKIELHQQCMHLIKLQAEKLNRAIKEIQEVSNNETKSSAGDKYETGRAMAQLEKDKLSQQLLRVTSLKKVLHQINTQSIDSRVKMGSVVYTDRNNFYISVGLGELKINDKIFIALSPVSPLGKLLMQKTIAETVSFNKITYTISEIL